MRISCFFIFLSIGLFGFSQSRMKLVCGVSKGETKYLLGKEVDDVPEPDQGVYLNNYDLNLGLQFFDRFNILLDIGFMNIPGRYYGTGSNAIGNMKTIQLGLNLDYRFLKNRLISPKIALSTGFYPYSNLKNKKVNFPNLYLDPQSEYEFKSWGLYGSLYCYLSVQLNHLFFDLGGGINITKYSMDKYTNQSTKKRNDYSPGGWGWKLKIAYAFPLSKESKSDINK